MNFRIAKQLSFSASHALTGLPSGHKCSRLHGHNYEVTIVVETDEIDKNGFVIDFGVLSDLAKRLDHRHLNDVMLATPTAENVAVWFAEQIEGYLGEEDDRRNMNIEVEVAETPTSAACYRTEISFV